jgi:dTDP-4-amino-4,6-dideoxygalactose transaminase
VGCFSFFANKNMTTGEGGMIVTNDNDLAGKIKVARSHGMTTLTWDRHKGHSFSYDVMARGYNYRLDEMRAALGMVQLEKLAAGNAKRRELTLAYQEGLRDLEQLELPFVKAAKGSTHHIFPILLKKEVNRAEFMTALAQQGIQTSIHYPPVHLFSFYQNLRRDDEEYGLPETEAAAAREVTLPLYPTLTMVQLDHVITAVRRFFR